MPTPRNPSPRPPGRQVSTGYQRNIYVLLKRKDHPYHRPDLLELGNYLGLPLNPGGGHTRVAAVSSADDGEPFAVVHDITNEGLTSYPATQAGLNAFKNSDIPPGSGLVFLRGFPSPGWLTAVGDKYKPTPELYRRHLDFQLNGRDYFSSPSLPSTSARVFHLTIPTICMREAEILPPRPEDMEQERKMHDRQMDNYLQNLRNNAKVADSIVRKNPLLGTRVSVLEQTISVYVSPPGPNWNIIVWLDSGRDLSLCTPGPWFPRKEMRDWQTHLLPVIVPQATEYAHAPPSLTPGTSNLSEFSGFPSPNVASPNVGNTPIPQTPASQPVSPGTGGTSNVTNMRPVSPNPLKEKWSAQNICQLPFHYGAGLDRTVAQHDAMYALSELLRFSASAELQFLNLLMRCIEHELSFIGLRPDVADRPGDDDRRDTAILLNLKYIKTQLTSHSHSLAETANILRNRTSLDWPRIGMTDEGADVVEKTAALLLADFDYLQRQADALTRACDQGIDTLANSVMLKESRRSAILAMSVWRLTIINTFFVPLAFVCTVWGMNFEGMDGKPLWLWPATTAPVVLLTAILYYWEDVKPFMHRVWLAVKV